jgi:4-alpha-glucanotransferase
MDHNCVVYTGTHDNETLYGWLDNVGKASLAEAKRFMDIKWITKKGFVKKMIRLAISSPANYCIIPIQDYLCLGNEARINEPSTLGTNWRWRLVEGQLTDKLADEMLYLANLYGRN